MTSCLEKLSPELQILILLQLPSTQSLYSLIRASPQYYQVFLTWKERILSAVVGRMVIPHVLPDAIAAVGASHLEPRGPGRETVVSSIESFQYDRKIDHSKKLLPLATSVSLCQLHRSVEYFVNDYTRRTTAALKQYCQSTGLTHRSEITQTPEGQHVPLSSIEEGRLHRAFYRLELYGRLFYRKPFTEKKLSALEQAHIFLAEFPPWEVEELACIRDYILLRLADVFDQVEEDFVKSILAEGHNNDDENDTKSAPPADIDDDDNDNNDDDNDDDEHAINKNEDEDEDEDEDEGEDEDGLIGPDRFDGKDYFFSKHSKVSYHDAYMEYMLSLGLPFLRHIFEASGEERTRSIIANGQHGGDFLSKALKAPPKQTVALEEEETAEDNGLVLQFQEDNLTERNEAWLWSKDFRPSVLWNELGAEGLREWGYVFWDSSRLRASDILIER